MVLLILSEVGMALASGSTSVCNSYLYSSDLKVIADTSPIVLAVLPYICSAAMGIGVYLSGDDITKKIGTKFVTYTNTAAFSAQFTAMAITLVTTTLGYPVSTTQTFVFALLGISLFNKKPRVVRMEGKLLRQLTIWWTLTIPICVGVTFLLSMLFSRVTGQQTA